MDSFESLEVASLSAAFASGRLRPAAVLRAVFERVRERGKSPIWIELVAPERAFAQLERAELARDAGEQLPLLGIPFAVKDNLDVAGMPTTAACPSFSYVARKDARVVERLTRAGAILVGKTNMDQFATGLVGTRSPYGAGTNAFDARYIAGGSSSGSALAVAHGLVSFALGTDTAGSGRVPAAFNNVVGLKPTRGLVSARGVVPACRTLDCVSVFAGSLVDAFAVLECIAGFDEDDAFSRLSPPACDPARFTPRASLAGLRLGAPPPSEREFFGDDEYAGLYSATLHRLGALGADVVDVGLGPFTEAARLLYDGPWIAERYAALGSFLEGATEGVDPIVRDIILGGSKPSARDAFAGFYRLEELRKEASCALAAVDALVLPTAPTHYRLDEVARDPIGTNKSLGYYTNFVNLLDLAAVATPCGFSERGLPFGVSVIGPAWSEPALASIADLLHRSFEPTVGATGISVSTSGAAREHGVSAAALSTTGHSAPVLLGVVGAHLEGQPLHHELVVRGARFDTSTRTTPDYRLFVLESTIPPKPGLCRSPGLVGPGIEIEVYALDAEGFTSFVSAVPAPLCIGTVELADGTRVKGFLCEPYAMKASKEITELGGWRAYLATLPAVSGPSSGSR